MFEPDLDGLTAFVTGASGGIGAEIAVTLADYGANVALAARSEGIYETAERVGEGALPVETDVTEPDSVASSVAATVEEFGGLDVLVNNAGAAGPTKPVEEIEPEEWQATTDVKVFGPFLCLKHSVPHLRESDQATVVNVSSVGGKRPYPNRSPYAAANMAMIGMGRTWAHELGEDGVTVNTICPGPVDGPRIRRVIEAQAEAQDRSVEAVREEQFYDDLAVSEFVQPEDVAEQVAYLASERGQHITSQDLNVDSGMTWY